MSAVGETITADVPPDPSPESTTPQPNKLEVFREVPNHDPRTLVLKYGEKLLDLQFCGCPNKYKKRFSAFLNENPELFTSIKQISSRLASLGYANIDIKEVLDSLRVTTKMNVSAAEYLQKFPHDFTLDSLPRAYLIRKLMMEDPALFGFFEISPVKCRSNCGFPSAEDLPEEEEPTSLAGF